MAREPEGVTYREVDAGGVPGIWCEPVGSNTDHVLLHSHAGGSVLSSAVVDRKLAGHIAKAAGAPVLVLDFRRAPEHKYSAQVDDAEAAFNWLLSEGYEPGNIITPSTPRSRRYRHPGARRQGPIASRPAGHEPEREPSGHFRGQ